MKTYWQKIKGIVGPAYSKDFDQIGQKNTRKKLENYIISNSNKKTLFLDAGCNTGVEAYMLYQEGYRGKYVGVDNNSKAVKFAKNNLKNEKRVSFFVSDISKLKFKDRYFEIVLCKDVIEHHEFYDKILAELSRVTKKYLILSMFIKPSFLFKDKIFQHPDGYYLNKYNRKKLFAFLIQNGFKKPKIIYQDWQDVVFVFERI